MNFIIDLDAIIDGEGRPKGDSIATLKALQDQGFRVIVVGDLLTLDDDFYTLDLLMMDAGGNPPKHLQSLPGPLVVVADGTPDDPPAVTVLTGGQGIDVLRRFVDGLPGIPAKPE